MAKDNLIPLMFTIPAAVLEQSEIALEASKTLSASDLLSAPAEAPGLLPMAQTVYALRSLKADPAHNTAEVIRDAENNELEYKEARSLIVARNKAASIGKKAHLYASATARAKAAILARKAEAAKAAKSA